MTDDSAEPQAHHVPQQPHGPSASEASPAPEHPRPERRVPPIPSYLLDPRPPMLIGTLAWTIALLAQMLFFDGDMRTVILCAVGVGVGAVGTAVYALQRRAVIAGSAGAQEGLDFDRVADQPAGN
ncbi:DUF2530 domain-containing protein [Dietzia aurantiaca]|uniref:DUF2530 domain-containing protein n=1 Tax=Dietzia aurantiaca TaxID=983873 RepID=UPI001E2B82A9|nr:DUF2530 domain-containing protein [Dietzia aurantiaca]MCD2263030.1 DUF2530 domain-containing protein [Dietzia aurantiaca]